MSYEEYVEFFEYNRRITYLLYSMDYCVYEYYVNKFLEKYNDIVSIICFISNQEICNCIESRSNFKELYKILKNSGAPLN